MKVFTVVCLVFALLTPGSLGAGDACQTRTEWGDNACNLKGSLKVKSVPNGAEVSSASCDLFFMKAEFEKEPIVSFPDAKSGEKYTLVMVDPDAPNHPKGTYYLHWIESNISGDDFKKGDLTNSKTISPYRGPTPPKGTGVHRYVLLVFSQPPLTRIAREVPDDQRARFDLGQWLQQYKLCGPETGVQFRTNFSGSPKN